MRRERRDSKKIFWDMLLIIGNGTFKPTHIMYETKQSWEGVQIYLSNLIEKGLVECREEDVMVKKKLSKNPMTRTIRRYYLTANGVEAYGLIKKLNKLLE